MKLLFILISFFKVNSYALNCANLSGVYIKKEFSQSTSSYRSLVVIEQNSCSSIAIKARLNSNWVDVVRLGQFTLFDTAGQSAGDSLLNYRDLSWEWNQNDPYSYRRNRVTERGLDEQHIKWDPNGYYWTPYRFTFEPAPTGLMFATFRYKIHWDGKSELTEWAEDPEHKDKYQYERVNASEDNVFVKNVGFPRMHVNSKLESFEVFKSAVLKKNADLTYDFFQTDEALSGKGRQILQNARILALGPEMTKFIKKTLTTLASLPVGQKFKCNFRADYISNYKTGEEFFLPYSISNCVKE